MARKVLNRKELRQQSEAAEQKETEEEKPVEKTVKKTVKKKAKRKARAKKVPKEVRLKAFWGVFNQSLRRVALFEYSQREQAEKKAEGLGKSAKTPHFVQLVKEVIEE